MPEMRLKDPIFGTYSACGPFTKKKKKKSSKIFRNR